MFLFYEKSLWVLQPPFPHTSEKPLTVLAIFHNMARFSFERLAKVRGPQKNEKMKKQKKALARLRPRKKRRPTRLDNPKRVFYFRSKQNVCHIIPLDSWHNQFHLKTEILERNTLLWTNYFQQKAKDSYSIPRDINRLIARFVRFFFFSLLFFLPKLGKKACASVAHACSVAKLKKRRNKNLAFEFMWAIGRIRS